jgi:hypothetical protein
MRLAFLVVLLCSAPICVAANCLEQFVEKEYLLRLVAARNVAELEKIYATRPHTDVLMKVMRAMRRHQLRNDLETQVLLVRAMPTSPAEFWLLYAATAPSERGGSERLSDTYYEYFEALEDAVVQRRMGLTDYLRMARFAQSGEMADILQGHYESLWERDRKGFRRALAELDRETIARICGPEAVPCHK